jgi:hypothetical protein
MAAPTDIIASGSYPRINFTVSTADVLMDSVTRSAKRDQDLFIGAASKAVIMAQYANPVLELEFNGFVATSTYTGFAGQHPGTTVNLTDIPGWPTSSGANVHGFPGDTGVFIFEDPKTNSKRTANMVDVSFKIMHYPYMGHGS